ncbi:MAG TPA: Crp/Fnr family transcriptional regulator [Clostridiales bacterium]|nr:Crp/Fnr family transcriptional regulator [Clostridiales bacterium]
MTEKDIETLKKSALFSGIEADKISSMLSCLAARSSNFDKETYIYSPGDRVKNMGIVLAGGVYVVNEDYWGNRSIVSKLGPADMFGESFSCAEEEKLPIGVVTSEKSRILFIDYRKIITTCSSACVFHSALIRNMVQILAVKNILLMQKIEHITKRTTREKVLSFLSEQAAKAGSGTFDIPFNRQELADFLSVDRSALSSELGRMRDEGILRFNKNHFELLKQ